MTAVLDGAVDAPGRRPGSRQCLRKLRAKMMTGNSPTATIASDGTAASANRSSDANW
jgi:hypothetical protein